ncbi:MAG: sigma-70 family RNA polymerase sigma factor [Cyclobacteriaceae bacterium]|nr:sigma-70 family RNA polymerase sigma factor [Cyclobacteriaceae bacterium]
MTAQEQESIFHDWLGRHKGVLFKIIRAYAFEEEDRDDLFQEISLQVWRSVPGFKGNSAVTTWLYRIALNTAIRWKGKERRHADHTSPLQPTMPVLQEDNRELDERIEWMYREIGRLNEVDRSLCLLLLDNFSYKEMADIVGISESNVAVKIHRIKKQLSEKSKDTDL